MSSGSATDGENTEPQIARELAVLEHDVDDRRQTEGGEADLPAITTERRRVARCYVSLASLGGRPGEHLQAFVTAAMQWVDADRAEREATAAASAALSGPLPRWQDAKRARDAATAEEQAARDALLIVARNVVIEARRSAEDHDELEADRVAMEDFARVDTTGGGRL